MYAMTYRNKEKNTYEVKYVKDGENRDRARRVFRATRDYTGVSANLRDMQGRSFFAPSIWK